MSPFDILRQAQDDNTQDDNTQGDIARGDIAQGDIAQDDNTQGDIARDDNTHGDTVGVTLLQAIIAWEVIFHRTFPIPNWFPAFTALPSAKSISSIFSLSTLL